MIHAYKLRIVLMSVVVFISFAIVVVTMKRDLRSNLVVIENTLGDNIGVSIGVAKHISIKNGLRQWALEASCISVDRAKNIMIDKPEIEFFSENHGSFYLSAVSGLINSISNQISFHGKVCGHVGDCIIETEQMFYDPATFSLSSGSTVIFFSEKLNVKADKIVINLSSKSLVFNGNVESIIINDLSF